MPLDTVHPALAAALLALPQLCLLTRAWIRHRTAVRLEQERTRRIQLALRRSGDERRADLVRACAELEAASRAGPPGAP
ncbi:hypothetical protein [Streptomyces boncukensis]|uniref:Uncharacterized protein n=1 Tax=Streptomyces boncukensis TaxID=2711219 RepID=A0A6G4X7X3_9ACTN|nr:hypothetical protein [Streptomyces boncukensis]NGO73625.1 hypothetical protein [Streptomyces boncukensis]